MKRNLSFIFKAYQLFFIAIFCFSIQSSKSQNKVIDSLKHELSKKNEGCDKSKILYKLGYHYNELEKADSAIFYCKQSLNFAIIHNCLRLQILNYGLYGSILDDISRYPEAIGFLNKGIYISQKNNDFESLSSLYTNLGDAYRHNDQYNIALTNYLKALEFDEKNHNVKKIDNDYFGLALLYLDINDDENAKQKLNKAIDYSKKSNDKPILARCYNVYGILLSKEKKLDSSLYYFNMGLDLALKLNDKMLQARILGNSVDSYFANKQYNQALKNGLQSAAINSELNNSNGLCYSYESIGSIYIEMHQLNEAKKYYNLAKDLALQSNLMSRYATACKKLALIYSIEKDYKNAYQYHMIFTRLNDSIFNIENTKELSNIKTNFEVKKNETELKAKQQKREVIFKAEQTKKELELATQKTLRNVFISGLFLFFGIIIYVIYNLRKSNQSHKIISEQKDMVESQKSLLEHKQKEIIESITYAKRIQDAILPPFEFVTTHLPNNFIFYKPKDIIAGDFYWAKKIGDLFFMAAADSTGHGVPGAMVSVVCSNALNRSVKEFNLTTTGKILDKTRELVLETFEKSSSDVKDGMDISLLCINLMTQDVFWSGANSSLLYIQNNELKVIKADKQPIGKSEFEIPFTTHQIDYKANTSYYLYTDGFADQFGGVKGKKFKYKQFAELIKKNNSFTMKQQGILLDNFFNDWKGNIEQVDDVCVIGINF